MKMHNYSINKIARLLVTALVLSGLLYSALPASPAYASTYLINDTSDPAPGDITVDGVCDSNDAVVGDQCTLREAIMEANAVNDTDYITFESVPTMTIVLTEGQLPAITNPLTIDGTTSGGRVTLDGNAEPDAVGLNIQASNVSVSGLAIINFDGTAVRISGGAANVVIDNNYIGVETDGSTDGQNVDFGIRIIDSPGVQVTDNLISGNDNGGVYASGVASDGLIIQGNIIGLNAAKNARVEDASTTGQNGIQLVGVTTVTIGGSGSLRNYISGNYGTGIVMSGDSTGTNIDGNYIGLDNDGEAAVSNLSGGIRMTSASGISIGVNQKNLISGNEASGIVANGVTDVIVQNNVVGLDVDGDTIIANQGHGLMIVSSSAVTIDNNVFSGNTFSGIFLKDGTTGADVTDNRIGVGEFSAVNLGNNAYGIYIDNSYDNMIGGESSGDSNLIAYNDLDGVFINNSDSGTYNSNGNAILRNTIYSNGGLGIDLAPNGVTSNDSGLADADSGPNTLQNFIVFTAKETDTGIQIVGTLDTDSSRPNYRLEFYLNNSCDSSGYGEGAQFLQAVDINIVADVTALDFEISGSGVSVGQYITATVTYDEITGGLKDTSEFSPCAVVQEQDSPGSSGVFVVNSTADYDDANLADGNCNALPGNVCTLRAAIQQANQGSEPPYTITFNIPGTAPHTIDLGSALPSIAVPVKIQGKPSGYAGAPLVILDGTGSGGTGLTITASGTTIDGLSLVDFSSSAILVTTTNVNVTNNYIGLLPDGTTVSGNGTGVNINGTTNTTVSGNVISGNTNGIRLVGAGAQSNTIKGNIIGLDASGALDKGNTIDGIRVEGGSLNTIGGLSASNRNVISGNNNDGIEITGGASANKIYINYIGVGSGGSGGLGNSAYGININSSSDNLVTYDNLIAFNGISGVYVSNGNGNLISSNSIYGNSSEGITLANSGNENIPAPVLTSANQGGTYIYVVGSISGAKPNTQYTLEFYENSTGPQGENLIFTSQATTDGSGNVNFSAGPPGTFPDLTLITANMRDFSNNSSEFSNGVFVSPDPAPVLTNTPTFTPSITPTPSETLNLRPTNTSMPTSTTSGSNPTNTPTSTTSGSNPTNTPTNTTSGSGGSGGGATTATPKTATNTPTITDTPTVTFTPTMLSQYQTLTALAAENTVEPTSTPSTPTVTLVPTLADETATDTPVAMAEAAAEQTATAEAAVADGSGGGGDPAGEPQADAGADGGGLFGENSQLMWILYIFVGLAALLLIVGIGMEVMRWMNSRE